MTSLAQDSDWLPEICGPVCQPGAASLYREVRIKENQPSLQEKEIKGKALSVFEGVECWGWECECECENRESFICVPNSAKVSLILYVVHPKSK
jgi:hypothetical protein